MVCQIFITLYFSTVTIHKALVRKPNILLCKAYVELYKLALAVHKDYQKEPDFTYTAFKCYTVV
jgi:hypothetical protein